MAEANALTDRQREYRDVYLHSEHWRWMRRQALARAEHRCQVCNSADGLDVHHRTYERLGAERPADLTALCRDCHRLFHEAGKVKSGAHRIDRPDELSEGSIRYVCQAVPDAQMMWLRAREVLKSSPWSSAREVSDAVPYENPRTYDDWAYRVLDRACADGLVQRRKVPSSPGSKRYTVEWALIEPKKESEPRPRGSKKQRRKAAAKKRRRPQKGDLARELAAMKARNAARSERRDAA